MPSLFNRKLGRTEFVPNELIGAARESGDYDIPDDLEVGLVTPAGRLVQGSLSDVQQAEGTLDIAPAPEEAMAERERAAYEEGLYGDSGLRAFGTGLVEGVTLGGYGAALRALDPEAAKVEGQIERHSPGASIGGQIVGAVVPSLLTGGAGAVGAAARLTPAGAAAALGTRIAGGAGGGIGRAALGLGVEGAIAGAGQGVHQLAMEQDPLTFEDAVSTISSNALLGAGTGAGAGILGKVAEKGLLRAKRAVDEGAARFQLRAGVADDVTGMDGPALRAARSSELESIEATRVPERATVADEVLDYRRTSKDEKWWLATKGDKDFAELNKVALKADKRLDVLTDDIKGLQKDPKWALKPLRQQEQRLQELVDRADEVRAKVAAEQAADAAPAPTASAEGFDPAKHDGSIALFDGTPTVHQGIPDASSLSEATFKQNAYVVRPSELAERDITGIRNFDEANRTERMGSVQKAWAGGDSVPALEIDISPRGRLYVADGNHRLLAAAADGDRPVLVRFRPLEQIATDDDLVEPIQKLVAGAPERRAAADAFKPVTPDELATLFAKPIASYSDDTHLAAAVYTDHSGQINGYARGRRPGAGDAPDEYSPAALMEERDMMGAPTGRSISVEDAVRALDEATASSKAPRDMLLYRGMQGDHIPQWKVGDVYTDPSFQSLSANVSISEMFGLPGKGALGKTMLEVEVPKGSNIANIFAKDRPAGTVEGELILPRGSRMRVLSVEDGYGPSYMRSTDVKTVRVRVEPAKTGATRLKALESAERLLERNRTLQAKIEALYTPPSSPRLTAIEDAQAAVSQVPKGPGMAETAAATYGATALMGLVPGGPIGAVAAVMAPKAVRKIGDWVFGRMGRAGAAARERSAKAVSALLDSSAKVTRVAPPLATRVLTKVQFAPEERRPAPVPRAQAAKLAHVYQAREREIMGQVTMAPDGSLVLRPDARERIADQLAGVRALSPILADRMETAAVARIEYLAKHLPRRPDMGAMQLGPVPWQPSEREMRTFARRVAAVEDPAGVEERAAGGIVTPEEADAYRTLYPERLAELTMRVAEQAPMMKRPLQWSRRLALTVLTGVPMDPALTPGVLRQMQGVYVEEPGSEGGTQAPPAQPQFGSVSREQGSPSQQREERRAL